ncbi:hypothetical protein CFC21_024243 [Triticum aestivum]|uniref:Ubiquitin-like protease family profile domain-containing protein n=2 Tax=Triticum aestivum TaxID=4565 RepID=A0A9R1EHA9_WHEAT|nr:hypothetical protein CFC21_024243 [Triticum aestivum]
MDSSGQEGGGVAQVVDPEGEEQTEYPPQGLRNDSAQEGGGVAQVDEPEGEEPTEYPPRGLRNDSGARVFPHKLCKSTYITRLSFKRWEKTVKQFSDIQLGHVRKYKMEALLHMPKKLKIPMNLLEWIDQHMFGTKEPCFKHKNKVIKITKDMVDKIFDFPGGTKPFVFSSDDPQVKAEVTQLRNKYIDHRNKMLINKIEEVMLSDETEDGFIRSFTFYFLSSILCPASYCFGNTKFLYSLRDVSAIPSLDFAQLALDFMREESERHLEMIMNRPSVEEMNKSSYIGGCLPIWGIIYLDFVDFDFIDNHQSTVDYSLPRICHVKTEDFKYLALVDRNYESRKFFGVLPLRDISHTPYYNVGPINNAPDADGVINSTPYVEVNNANSVPEALHENTSIDSKSPHTISEIPSSTAKVEADLKPKPEPHLKTEVPSSDVLKPEPIGPKFENIFVLNSVYKTPIFPAHTSNVNTNSVHQETTSQPKEVVFLSAKADDIKFSTEVNAKRSFILISSASGNERVKRFQGTPILIDDDSPTTPAAATNEVIPASHCDTSEGIPMNMEFSVQLGYSSLNNAEAGPSTRPNTIEKKNRKKRAAKLQSPDAPKKLKISQEVDIFFSKYLRKPIFQE